MSAYTTVYVRCDHVDKDAPPGRKLCYAEVAPAGDGFIPQTKAEARREAKRQGWLVRLRHDGRPGGDWDYCPDHRAAHERQKEAPGAAQA